MSKFLKNLKNASKFMVPMFGSAFLILSLIFSDNPFAVMFAIQAAFASFGAALVQTALGDKKQ